MPKALAAADYRKLLADIRKEMEHGLKRVEELLERQKVLFPRTQNATAVKPWMNGVRAGFANRRIFIETYGWPLATI